MRILHLVCLASLAYATFTPHVTVGVDSAVLVDAVQASPFYRKQLADAFSRTLGNRFGDAYTVAVAKKRGEEVLDARKCERAIARSAKDPAFGGSRKAATVARTEGKFGLSSGIFVFPNREGWHCLKIKLAYSVSQRGSPLAESSDAVPALESAITSTDERTSLEAFLGYVEALHGQPWKTPTGAAKPEDSDLSGDSTIERVETWIQKSAGSQGLAIRVQELAAARGENGEPVFASGGARETTVAYTKRSPGDETVGARASTGVASDSVGDASSEAVTAEVPPPVHHHRGHVHHHGEGHHHLGEGEKEKVAEESITVRPGKPMALERLPMLGGSVASEGGSSVGGPLGGLLDALEGNTASGETHGLRGKKPETPQPLAAAEPGN